MYSIGWEKKSIYLYSPAKSFSLFYIFLCPATCCWCCLPSMDLVEFSFFKLQFTSSALHCKGYNHPFQSHRHLQQICTREKKESIQNQMNLNWLTIPFRKNWAENFTSQPNKSWQILTNGNFWNFSARSRVLQSRQARSTLGRQCADSTTC